MENDKRSEVILQEIILRAERCSLLIGTMIGQMSELLNNIKTVPMTNEMIYQSLFDIWNAAGLQVHNMYYKGNKP